MLTEFALAQCINAHVPVMWDKRSEFLGVFRPRSRTIIINAALIRAYSVDLRHVLLHEFAHSIRFMRHGLTNDEYWENREYEELLVDSAAGLALFLLDPSTADATRRYTTAYQHVTIFGTNLVVAREFPLLELSNEDDAVEFLAQEMLTILGLEG